MSKRNEIHELALKFIESEEMREYWGDTLLSGNISTELIFNPVRDCGKFITGSRSSVDDKLAALRKLPPDKEILNLIRAAEAALTEVKNSNGDVFLTTLHFPYDNTVDLETWDDRKPFLSFESVISYVQRATAEQCKIYGESLAQCMERIWYEVEKFMGELPENEQALKIISEAIKKIPSVRMNRDGESVWWQHELAEQFDEFFCELLRSENYKKQNDSREPGSCSWDEFRERFKI